MKQLSVTKTMLWLVFFGAWALPAQDEPKPAPRPAPDDQKTEAPRPGGGGPAGPPGGFGGMMGQKTKLVARFDTDGDKRLNAAERKAARQFLEKERAEGRGPRGFGGPGGMGPGPALAQQIVSQADKDARQENHHRGVRCARGRVVRQARPRETGEAEPGAVHGQAP
jgi:hypothetical protein